MKSLGNSSGKANWLLVVALLFILGGGFVAYWVQTDGNKVEIRDV